MSDDSLGRNVRRVRLPSPTMPPFDGTNCYLLGSRGVGAIVDPGFDDDAPLDELRGALDELGVTLVKAILLTHTHPDHVASLQRVWREFGEPAVYLHPAELSRIDTVPSLTALNDGRTVTLGELLVTAVHTPGHSPGHLCFHLPEEGVLLAGDLLAGEGSIWVGVPEGDMADYLASLERAASLSGLSALGPGHGPVRTDPYLRLAEVRDHRLQRERQVLSQLSAPRSLRELRERVYPDVPADAAHLAESSLLAHLRKLMNEMRVVHLGEDEKGPFAAAEGGAVDRPADRPR